MKQYKKMKKARVLVSIRAAETFHLLLITGCQSSLCSGIQYLELHMFISGRHKLYQHHLGFERNKQRVHTWWNTFLPLCHTFGHSWHNTTLLLMVFLCFNINLLIHTELFFTTTCNSIDGLSSELDWPFQTFWITNIWESGPYGCTSEQWTLN